jgi:NADPH:quinone reductase-like Zn-dependent oxidoreductase
MKAFLCHTYGPPETLRYQEVPKPVPAPTEVLLKIRAASVNPYDWHLMRGEPYFIRIPTGLRKPKEIRTGADVAGEVEAIGADVTQFKKGDAVFGSCKGAFAEYACAAESALVAKPSNATFEQAASIPIAAFTALQALRYNGPIQPGRTVLINGASGGVGTFAVQIAHSFGAEVTAVCSTGNLDLVQSIGAAHIIDYTREDFTRTTRRYDFILDAIGNRSMLGCNRILKPGGALVVVGAPAGRWMLGAILGGLTAPWLSRFAGRKLTMLMAKLDQADLATMRDLVQSAKVTPVIDRRYPLTQLPEAIRYLEQGHARGKVTIHMD